MAEICPTNKALAVNPLKVSQPVGASLVFMGLARSMPLEHGARGCAAFNKLFFMRHFRDPIPLQTTAMDQVTTVIGSDDNVVEALATICEKNAPAVIGLITTGLSATQGADIPRTVRDFRAAYPAHNGVIVIPVAATDTLGCLETGYALAIEAIIGALVPISSRVGKAKRQVNVLAGPGLTPGDIESIREWIEMFELKPIFLPDLADSLDGHFIDEGYSTLTYGGTKPDQIATMGESIGTLVIGASLSKAADLLHARTGVPDYRFAGVTGLAAADRFTETLRALSGRPVPRALERQRAQLQDAMVDCVAQFGGAQIALGLEPDLLCALGEFLTSMGARIAVAVSPTRTPALSILPIDQVIIGDLEDLEQQARTIRADLLITNSHGAEIAARLGIPLLRAGYPVCDIYGGHWRNWSGYRGTRHAVFDIANLLSAHFQEIAPYRSIYWQGTARANEAPPHAAPGALVV